MFKRPPTSFEQMQVKTNFYQPLLFNLSNLSDSQDLDRILCVENDIIVSDNIKSQITELIVCQNPSEKLTENTIEFYTRQLLNGHSLQEFGIWVYYPWSRRLVHTLPEKEFIELRTSRNNFKITPKEQAILATKKVGIIGLSVGQSVALTMAMERSFGEIRLADFDALDLSNLNRIRTPLYNLGQNKAILAAREIVEIDPFLKVKCFTEGVNDNNIDQFFQEDGLLDLLIEECDDFEIKLLAREKAKSLKIPVVMDTSDRGMLDVERFDLEPDRKVFHGKLDNLNRKDLNNLSNEQKVLVALKMLGVETLSTRMKASMIEINQQIKTWPQLATSVILGGAVTGNVSRRIFLDQFNDSGRYTVDLDKLICEKEQDIDSEKKEVSSIENRKDHLIQITKNYDLSAHKDCLNLKDEILTELMNAVILAPSGGNSQPWYWISFNDALFLFYDPQSPKTLLDVDFSGTRLALGAASENLIIKANSLGLKVNVELHDPQKAPLTAVFSFVNHKKSQVGRFKENSQLSEIIPLRLTNRKMVERTKLDADKIKSIKQIVPMEDWMQIVESPHQLDELAKILARIERVRILHPQGHKDLFEEIRWTKEESEETQTGIDLRTMDIESSAITALKLVEDPKVIEHIKSFGGGSGFDKLTIDTIKAASAVGCIFLPKEADFWSGGRIVQRVWLKANQLGIAFQPVTASLFLFHRFLNYNAKDLSCQEQKIIEDGINNFQKIFPFDINLEKPIFLFKLSKADHPLIKSLRKPLDKVFHKM